MGKQLKNTDQGQTYYEYLKANKADVPPTYDSFKSTLSNPEAAKKYHKYVIGKNLDGPEDYEQWAKVIQVGEYSVKKKDDTLPESETSSSPALDSEASPLASPEGGVPLDQVGVGLKSPDEQRHELEQAAASFEANKNKDPEEMRFDREVAAQEKEQIKQEIIGGGDFETPQEKSDRVDPVVNIGKTAWNVLTNQIPSAFASFVAQGHKLAEGRTLNPEKKIEYKEMQKSALATAKKFQDEGIKLTENTINSIDKIENPWDAFIWATNAATQAGIQIPLAVASGGSSSIIQETGSIYLDSVLKIAKEKGITPDEVIDQNLDDPGAAMAYGAAAAILDRIGAGKVLGAKEAFKQSLRQRAKTLLTAGIVEGQTEYTQTWLEQIGAEHGGEKGFTEALKKVAGDEGLRNNRIEAWAQGTVGGAGVASVVNEGSVEKTIVAPEGDLGKPKVEPEVKKEEVKVEPEKPKEEAKPVSTDDDGTVKDKEGKPLVVFRGQHGKSEVESRLGSISFSDTESDAKIYSESPNNKTLDATAKNPNVIKANISIKKPVINTPDDPFIEMSVVKDILGEERAKEIAIKNSEFITDTNNWEENYSDYSSVEELLKAKPEELGKLYMNAFPIFDDIEIVKEFKEKGYDGAIHAGYGEGDGAEYKVFSPEQVKPIKDTQDAKALETTPTAKPEGEPTVREDAPKEEVQKQAESKPAEEVKTSETKTDALETQTSSLETARKRLDDAKAKAKSIRDSQTKNLGAIKDNLRETRERARADREVFDAYVGLASEYVKSGVNSVEEFAKQIGEDVNELVTNAWDVATGKIKKTIVTKRAYEGAIGEGVKAELEKIGLTREIERQEDAKERSQKFVKAVGIELALDAVRKNTVQGASAAYIWNEALQTVERRLAKATEPEQIQKLEKQQAQLFEEFSKKALEGGRFSSALNDIYQNSEIAYNLQRKIQEYKDLNDGKIPADVESRFREYDRQLKDLKVKITEAEERAKFAEENQAVSDIKESITRAKNPKNIKIAAKVLANKIRKARVSKPGIFMAATPASIVLDGAVEAVALAVEAGGTIAQAVADGLAHIRKSKWYQDLADEKQQEAEKAFRDYIDQQSAEEDTQDSKIKIPFSVIRDLVERGIDNINDLVTAVKERVKDEYPDATDREIRDAITQYGKTVNMSQDEINIQIRRMKRLGRLYSALEDVQNKKRPLRSGLQRDKLDAEERALNKQIREEIKDLPIDEETESKEQKTALDAAKQRIKNQIEDLNREIETGEQVEKSARTIEQDEELKALISERDQIKEVHESMFKSNELSDDQKLKAATRAVERNIEEYERKIKEGELAPKKKDPLKETAELKALRQRRDHVKDVFKQMRDEAGITEKQRLDTSKKNVQKKITDLERRLKDGDFSKVQRKQVVQDTELIDLNAQKIRIQEKYDKEFYKNELANRTRREKIIDTLWEVWGLTRGLRATGEFSFVLIQGLTQTVAHPLHAATAFKNAFKFFSSEERTEKWLAAVKSQPFYPVMKQSKLALTEPNAELNAREELFYSGWTNVIWNSLGAPLRLKSPEAFQKWTEANPFRAIERASIGYLDTIRVLRFLDGMEMLDIKGKTFEKDPQEYKDLADAINTLTGRASLGRAEQVADTLTKIFFSPRNWASVMKTSTPYAFYHFGKMQPTARKIAITDFSRFVGLTTAMVAVCAAALNDDDDDETGVEFDPRSSDFLKIRLGNRRIDPWGGRIQMIVLQARIIMDSVKNAKGEVIPLGTPYKSDTREGLLLTMATNKLAPSAAILHKYLTSRQKKDKSTGEMERVDKYGNPYKVKDELLNNLYPIYWETLSELYKDEPSALNGLFAFYAFLGGGVNVYESDTKKKESK